MTYILKRFPTLLLYNLNSESNCAWKVTCLVSLLFWFHSRLNFKDFPTLLESNKRLLVYFKRVSVQCSMYWNFRNNIVTKSWDLLKLYFLEYEFWITNTRRLKKGHIKCNDLIKCSSAMKEFFLIWSSPISMEFSSNSILNVHLDGGNHGFWVFYELSK